MMTFRQYINENPDAIYQNGLGCTFFVLRRSSDLSDIFSNKAWPKAMKAIEKRIKFPCVLIDVPKTKFGAAHPMILTPAGRAIPLADIMDPENAKRWKKNANVATSTHDGLIWEFIYAALGDDLGEWAKSNGFRDADEVLADFESREVGVAGRLIPSYVSTWKECGIEQLQWLMDVVEKATPVRFVDSVEAYEAPDPLESVEEMDQEMIYHITRRKSGRFST